MTINYRLSSSASPAELAANHPHALKALKRFKMILTKIQP